MEERELKKNNFLKSKTGIAALISAAILLIGGVVIGGSFIVPKNISGAWELMKNPEIEEKAEGDVLLRFVRTVQKEPLVVEDIKF